METTFTKTPKDNPKDRIQIEIGDSKQPDFKPQMKIMRWDNEVNFSMRAEEHPDATVEEENDVVKYKTPKYEVHQYDKPEASEDGGFEFEWVLNSKPTSNILTSTIQTKGLDFFYQGKLTKDEIKEGVNRPENVVGSYAVYHSTKKNNIEGGMEYKTGKAFHIYRPKASDANGNEVWCDLNIDIEQGKLTVTIPQKFLDKATFPVLVDPTFGYSTIGASSASTANGFGSKYSMNAENGTLTKMTIYTKAASGTITKRAAIYSDVSGVPTALLVQDTGGTAGVGTSASWVDVTMNSYSLVTSTVYWLAQWHSASSTIYWDAGAAGQYQFVVGSSAYPTWIDPADSDTPFSRKLSIYATYTAGGGVTTSPFLSLLGVGI